MIIKPYIPLLKTSLVATFVATLLTSCTIANTHKVRQGLDPRFQDDNVAFRTTYYFRVFDHCAQTEHQKHASIPKSNAVYRFRMTGKSKVKWNKIRFESGILKSWQLDPLGAAVIFDESTGRFRYISQSESDNNIARKNAWAEYKKLAEEYKRLTTMKSNDGQMQIELMAEKLKNKLMSKVTPNVTAFKNQSDASLIANKAVLDSLNSELHKNLEDQIDSQVAAASNQMIESAKLAIKTAQNSWLNQQVSQKRSEHFDQQVKSYFNFDQGQAFDLTVKLLATDIRTPWLLKQPKAADINNFNQLALSESLIALKLAQS